MALRQNSATQTPAFESADSAGAVDQATVDQTTAVAAAKTTAVAKATPFQAAYQDKREVIALEDVENLGYGAFDRITADLGGLILNDAEIGKTAKVEIISWNLRYMLVPNSNDAAAKKLVKVSYDNKTVAGEGTPIEDEIAAMKAQGYEKAGVKTYGDIWGQLVNTEKGGDIAEAERKMVQVQLSPESLKKFKAFQVNAGLRKAKGVDEPGTITITAERGEFNGNRYGYMTFA